MANRKAQVVIILGSASDELVLDESGAPELLDACGIPWQYLIIHADSQTEVLVEYCRKTVLEGAHVFIGVGWLATAIAASIKNSRIVFGVPFASGERNGMDALATTQSWTHGTVQGFGKYGFYQAAIMAAQALGIGNARVRVKLDDYLREQTSR